MESDRGHYISRRILVVEDATQCPPLATRADAAAHTLPLLDGRIVAVALLAATFLLLFAVVVYGVVWLLRRFCRTSSSEKNGLHPHPMGQEIESQSKVPKASSQSLSKAEAGGIEPLTVERLGRAKPHRSRSFGTFKSTLPSIPIFETHPTDRMLRHDGVIGELLQRHQQPEPRVRDGSPLSASLPDLSGAGQQGLIGIDVQTQEHSGRLPARIWFSVTTNPTPSGDVTIYIDRVEYHQSVRSESKFVGDEREAFVCAYLLPDENYQLKTKSVLSKTDSQIIQFDENMKFQVAAPSDSTSFDSPTHLRLSVYEVDAKRLRHTVGHVIVALDLGSSEGEILNKELETDEILRNYHSNGELLIALTYDPDNALIRIKVKEARNLTMMDADAEHCIQVEILNGNRVLMSKRTEVQRCQSSFSCHSFLYEKRFKLPLPVAFLEDSSIQVSLITFDLQSQGHRSRVEHGFEYGVMTLGSHKYSSGEELAHWVDSITNPFESVTRWHGLARPSP